MCSGVLIILRHVFLLLPWNCNKVGKDNAAKYLHYECNGTTPMDFCQAWADEMVHNREWLDNMGIVNTPFGRATDNGSLGHIHGQVYNMSGANYCECFVWGLISGRNATAENPWA